MAERALTEAEQEELQSITRDDVLEQRVKNYDPVGYHYSYVDPAIAHNFPPFSPTRIRDMLTDPRLRFGLRLIKGPIHSSTMFLSEEQESDPSVAQTIIDQDIQFPYVVRVNDDGGSFNSNRQSEPPTDPKKKDKGKPDPFKDKKKKSKPSFGGQSDFGDDDEQDGSGGGPSQEISEFIIKTLKRFWARGLMKALTAVEWGYSGSEVIYGTDSQGELEYLDLCLFRSENVRPVKYAGGLCGMNVYPTAFNNQLNFSKPLYIGIPKCLWHVQNREVNPLYGESFFYPAYIPWWEQWCVGGSRETRRTWFYKNAFDGGTVYYKPGTTNIGGGVIKSNKELATEMLAKGRSGGYRIFPSEYDQQSGKLYWAYEPPSANTTPQGLLEYHDSLRAEELEGMGVPPEVIESQGSDGMGSSTGRKIPLIAFRSTLRSVADSVLYDFSCQVLDALLFFRYGRMISYSIEPYLPSAANSIQPDLDMISAKNGMPPGSGNPGDKKPDDPDAFDKADLGT